VGDEVIFSVPAWFCYEGIIIQNGAVAVKVPVNPHMFDLDPDAIAAAITPRTRAIIVNSPNNPTGRNYPPETLQKLAEILTHASLLNGRPIYLISDEAYSRIVLSGHHFVSPTHYYPFSLLVYTYGKVLLTPGQRIGFIALPPSMPDKQSIRDALLVASITLGWTFPNAVMQYAIPQLSQLSIDIASLERRRNRLYRALTDMGYDVMLPEGTFYLNVLSPLDDAEAFVDLLAQEDVFCLPGKVMQMPGYIRLSLTANDSMVEESLPRFRHALDRATAAN